MHTSPSLPPSLLPRTRERARSTTYLWMINPFVHETSGERMEGIRSECSSRLGRPTQDDNPPWPSKQTVPRQWWSPSISRVVKSLSDPTPNWTRLTPDLKRNHHGSTSEAHAGEAQGSRIAQLHVHPVRNESASESSHVVGSMDCLWMAHHSHHYR